MDLDHPTYHMIIHALRMVLHLNKKHVSDVQIPRTCIQNRLLYTLNMEKCWLNIPKQNIFWDAKILAIQTYFIIIKIGFI